MAARILHHGGRGVEPHRLAVQERTGEDRRPVATQPGGDVRQERERGGVTLGETVLAEPTDLIEDPLGEGRVDAALDHPPRQPVVVLVDLPGAPPGGHVAAKLVRLPGGVSASGDRQLHHLLLEDRHPEGLRQDRLQVRVRVDDRLIPCATAQIGVDHVALDRPRPDDGHLDHQIVEGPRLQPRQHRHLRSTLDLEHPHRIPRRAHRIGRRVLGGDLHHRVRRRRVLGHELEGLPDAGQRTQPEQVDLEEPQRLHIVLVPLDDGPPLHGGRLDRHQLIDREMPQ